MLPDWHTWQQHFLQQCAGTAKLFSFLLTAPNDILSAPLALRSVSRKCAPTLVPLDGATHVALDPANHHKPLLASAGAGRYIPLPVSVIFPDQLLPLQDYLVPIECTTLRDLRQYPVRKIRPITDDNCKMCCAPRGNWSIRNRKTPYNVSGIPLISPSTCHTQFLYHRQSSRCK